jgi:Na+/H+-dicarboxylate symporter
MALHWQILIGMLVGLLAGLVGGEGLAERVGWIGALFVRLLKMVIVPLVFTSIISGVASIGGGRRLGGLFAKTFGYYLLSSAIAVLIGLAMVNLLRPGEGASLAGAEGGALPEIQTPDSVSELFLKMVPTNVVDAAATPDMLAIIVFSILFGAAIASLPDRPRTLLSEFFDAAFQAMMALTGFVIRLAPIGVFALIARVTGTSGLEAFSALLLYMLAIAGGLSLHLFVALPLLLILLGRIRPSIHFRNMLEPLTMAFSTASSAATLPVTLRAVETKVGVSNRISSFVLPMGATVNMDGTALYECAGVLFIAQVLGVDLSFSQQLVVVVTALLASIGAAAVPSAGLVVIFLVLESVNLRGPQVDVIVGAMLAIDRPLDMLRTSVNVFSDSCGAAIIARSEGEVGVDSDDRTAGTEAHA